RIECLVSALEHGSVGNIEAVAFLAEQLASRDGFCLAVFGQIHIGPAGKAVFLIPRGFTMAHQYDLVHVSTCFWRCSEKCPAPPTVAPVTGLMTGLMIFYRIA